MALQFIETFIYIYKHLKTSDIFGALISLLGLITDEFVWVFFHQHQKAILSKTRLISKINGYVRMVRFCEEVLDPERDFFLNT